MDMRGGDDHTPINGDFLSYFLTKTQPSLPAVTINIQSAATHMLLGQLVSLDLAEIDRALLDSAQTGQAFSSLVHRCILRDGLD